MITIERKTKETEIKLQLDVSGQTKTVQIDTGLPFSITCWISWQHMPAGVS